MSRGRPGQGENGDQPWRSSAINEVCGRFRRKVTSLSPLGMTSSRLRYQDLRGLTRNFSVDLPVIRSQVHLTSAAVDGLPSCNLTPSRSLKVSSFPSSLHDQLEARSETIELRVLCGTCWSNITRLLNTPIIGPSTTIVDSSWGDTLAMLVPSGILRTPPDFCAKAGSLAHRPPSAPHATNKLRSFAFICLGLSRRVGSPAPFHGVYLRSARPPCRASAWRVRHAACRTSACSKVCTVNHGSNGPLSNPTPA